MGFSIKSISKIDDNIEGWLSKKEGRFLYEKAKNCQDGVIVEIGSWKGKSTVWLSAGSMMGKKIPVYAIDPHTGSSEHKMMYGNVWTFDEFKKNIKKASSEELVVPIVKTSEEAAGNWDKAVSFLFIDGAHEYDLVEIDFKLWFPRLIERGVIAFHDTFGWSGPRKVVEKYIYKSDFFRDIGFVNSITYATKSSKLSLKDKIKNRIAFILRFIYKCFGAALLTNFRLYLSHRKFK